MQTRKLARPSLRKDFFSFPSTAFACTPEDAEALDRVRDAHVEKFQPRDQIEFDLVDDMAISAWRSHKFAIYERILLDLEAKALENQPAAALPAPSRAILLMERSRQNRAREAAQAMKMLSNLRRYRPIAAEPARKTRTRKLPNKANPISGHSGESAPQESELCSPLI
jgi:hypothetical protein